MNTRRSFLRQFGLATAALPFTSNLQAFATAARSQTRKQRLVVLFSPNGTVPWDFWPDHGESQDQKKKAQTEFALSDREFKPILKPMEPFRDRMLVLKGVSDKLQGDGDRHMRGMGCLLTGSELHPGNVQGGSDTPAGWASGISIDQELRRFLQAREETRTRFGSLEFGVMVPDRADVWNRMSYAGSNKPITPIDNPYQMFRKLYGRMRDRSHLVSVLDHVQRDLERINAVIGKEDRALLEEHATFVRSMEKQLASEAAHDVHHAVPDLESGVREVNDNMPKITKMQMDLLVNSFTNDFARIATFQITNSVGQPRMTWLGIKDGHHGLSHEPDSNKEAHKKLTKINTWYCEQMAYLTKRLAETPEPGGDGTLLDNTVILWGNELGQGNNHTLNNIPFVLAGNGLDFNMGQFRKYREVPHNRLLLSIAAGFGHHLDSFGEQEFCGDGPLSL